MGTLIRFITQLLRLIRNKSEQKSSKKTNDIIDNYSLTPKIKCSEIKNKFKEMDLNEVWSLYLPWVETVTPLWIGIIEKFGEITGISDEKLDFHKNVVKNAFTFMDNWWYNRIDLVKARKKEIDSAISFIFTNAKKDEISNYLLSPVAINLTGLLRTTLTISTNGYKQEDIPLLLAKNIYDLGEVKSFFPIETTNFIPLLPKGKGLDGSSLDYSEDNYHLMMKSGALKYKLENELRILNQEVEKIWTSFKIPQIMDLPTDIWERKTEGLSMRLYKQNLDDFHNR